MTYRPTQTTGRAARAGIESLESRRLLSAVLLKDIDPGIGGSTLPSDFSPTWAPAEVNGRVVFAATDEGAIDGVPRSPSQQTDVWTTDGTPQGTVKLLDIAPPGEFSAVANVSVVNGRAVFFGSRGFGNPDRHLFVTDGTPGGTTDLGPLRYFADATSGYFEEPPAVMNNVLYFSGGPANGTDGTSLMRTDGTAAGTYLVKDIVPGTPDVVANLTAVGNTLYFTVGQRFSGPDELWKSDGTEAGTVLVKRFDGQNGTPLNADDFGAVGNRVFFRTRTAAGNPQLWTSDGTEAGTVLLKEFQGDIPANGHTIRSIVDLNGIAMFVSTNAAGGPQTGMELWRSDGTPAGTTLVKDILRGSTGSDPDTLHVVNGTLYFAAFGGASGRELWKSDGTAAGTAMVADVNPNIATSGVYVWPAVKGQSRVFFTQTDGVHGTELWASDGTAAGTRLVEDINPGANPSVPTFPIALGPALFVRASTTGIGNEPWRVDLPAGWGAPFVADRHVFYNGSGFDGGDRAADARDDGAMAINKHALRAGQSPSYENWTNYYRGINGVMVDVANVWDAPAADDFVFRVGRSGSSNNWQAAPAPTVSVRRGAGTSGTDRVTFTWPDGAAPRNAWLQVTVKANGRTGLAQPDVFCFGNLVGDTGLSPGRVDSSDQIAVRRARRSGVGGITSNLDFNRDGRLDIRDEWIIRMNASQTLPQSVAAGPAPASITAALLDAER